MAGMGIISIKMRILKILFLTILLGGIIPAVLYMGAVWKSLNLNISRISLYDINFYRNNLNIIHSNEPGRFIQSMGLGSGELTIPSNSSVVGDPQRNATSSAVVNISDTFQQKKFLHATQVSSNISYNVMKTSTDVMKTSTSVMTTSTTAMATAASVIVNTDLCPDKPPGLVGRIKVNKTLASEAELNAKYQSINKSGHFKPEHCRGENKTAIIIAYRNREHHLWVLINNLVPFLIKQQLEFSIFVVEPTPNVTFNRALLMNVGFIEALKLDNYTCFVFHDVDLVPENDNNLYRCATHARHMACSNSKFHYRLPYGGYAGGILALSKEQYLRINGHSNLYFGWGGEDDDIYYRLNSKGYKLVRYPMEIGRYYALSHGSDEGNKANDARMTILGAWKGRMESDGINSLKYSIKQLQVKNLFIWVYVDVDWPFYKSKLETLLKKKIT